MPKQTDIGENQGKMIILGTPKINKKKKMLFQKSVSSNVTLYNIYQESLLYIKKANNNAVSLLLEKLIEHKYFIMHVLM